MRENNFKRRTSLISLTTLALLTSTLVTPISAKADVIQSTECFPAVLMLKGSGEGTANGEPVTSKEYTPSDSTTGEPFILTNGHEGNTLGRLLQSFVNETVPAETVSKVRFIGIETPSLPVAPTVPEAPEISGTTGAVASEGANALLTAKAWGKHVIQYNESYRTGAQMVLDFIEEDERRDCDTQYMLLSYSQGVISARLAMNMLGNETNKVISSYVMGDPFQKADGASAPFQLTDANSSPNTDGVARAALRVLITIGKTGGPFTANLTEGLTNYRDEIIGSDPFIYRDDLFYTDEGEERIVSRSLCHKNDPTCDLAVLNAEAHLNYFDSDTEAGTSDINLEVAEFDKQVQVLANSAKSDPRERALAKSPSLIGGITSYNVTNTRPDDRCSWDENSDGTNELINVPCEVHSVTHATPTAKMSVVVTDSFGIPYPLNSEIESLDPDIVDKISALDTNTWYQFAAYDTVHDTENYWSPECLLWSQPADWPMIRETDEGYSSLISDWVCNPSISDATYSTSVFKADPYETPEGTKVRMISAYDANHAWVPGRADENYGNDIRLLPTSSERNQDVTTKLVSIIDDKPYYTFEMEGRCVTFVPSFIVQLLECDPTNSKQLFSASPAINAFEDSSKEFGNLSYESDKTSPSDVTGLHVETSAEAVNLKWDTSKDDRGTSIEYLIYRKDNVTGEFQYISSYYGWTEFAIDLNEAIEGETYTYKIFAKDGAENLSNPSSISFVIPPLIAQPHTPLLENVTGGPSSVTLNFPSYPDPNAIGVKIYRDGQYLSTITSSTFVDTNVEPDNYYVYSYSLAVSDNVSSEMSEKLWVSTSIYE